MPLSETLQEDDNDNNIESLTTQWSEQVSKLDRKVGDSSAFAYEDDRRHEREVEELRQKLQKLKVVSRAKVTNSRIYSSAYHPDPAKDIVFFGG